MDLIKLLPDLIWQAANQVYQQDQELLSLSGNEQAVVFRFAIYLDELVKDHLPKDVALDIEYNKVDSRTKNLTYKRTEEEEARKHDIRPDIILHQRKTSNHNLLVIECKRNVSEDFKDFSKLRAMTSDPNYQYKLGCFINFANRDPKFTYFVDGEIAKNLAKVIV